MGAMAVLSLDTPCETVEILYSRKLITFMAF